MLEFGNLRGGNLRGVGVEGMDGRGWVRVFVEIGSGRLEMNGLVWYGRYGMVWCIDKKGWY